MEITKQDLTVYLVDDEFSIRDSLTLLIESTGLKVKSYSSACSFLEDFNPDLPGCLIVDMRMPVMNGLELQKELKKMNCYIPVIFISGHADIPISSKAFRAGALDFLEKPFDNNLILQRIDEMVEKLLVTWPEIQKKREILNRYTLLTPREKEVFMYIVHNHSNKETAKQMGISNRTVDIHRSNVMKKMQADSFNALVIMAVSGEIFDLTEKLVP